MPPYLGDYAEDASLSFLYSHNDIVGAAIVRSTDGTVSVYKDIGATQSTAGVTDADFFDRAAG